MSQPTCLSPWRHQWCSTTSHETPTAPSHTPASCHRPKVLTSSLDPRLLASSAPYETAEYPSPPSFFPHFSSTVSTTAPFPSVHLYPTLPFPISPPSHSADSKKSRSVSRPYPRPQRSDSRGSRSAARSASKQWCAFCVGNCSSRTTRVCFATSTVCLPRDWMRGLRICGGALKWEMNWW